MSSIAISPLVLEKKIFFKVFTIYGHGGHLGHVTQPILYKFSFLLYHKLSRSAAMDTFRWGTGGTSLGEWEHNNNHKLSLRENKF